MHFLPCARLAPDLRLARPRANVSKSQRSQTSRGRNHLKGNSERHAESFAKYHAGGDPGRRDQSFCNSYTGCDAFRHRKSDGHFDPQRKCLT